ncbi:hypothetical protein NC651_014163 [Populus alba x Populus x berolinensis]|nr:hypothetical protein NC651_014163 [Populus alba x Populus x berolinensis]
MGQDYVKRMEADSNTFRKQRGSYNEVVVKGLLFVFHEVYIPRRLLTMPSYLQAVYRYQYYIIDIGWYNVISWMLLH